GKGTFFNTTTLNAPELEKSGMVTAALWTDFDNDGWTDLIVVGEFMPITLFKNNHGKLQRVTDSNLDENSRGWWFSIAEGDMDNDGDMDYIIGNLGRNNMYDVSEQKPLSVYANDFGNNGTIKPI